VIRKPPRIPLYILKDLLELMEKAEGQVLRQDFYRILGSDLAVRRWVDGCLVDEKLIEVKEVKRGNKKQKIYIITEHGKTWHKLLENWYHENVRLLRRLSGRRLKSKHVL
jgi:hypothetical protein